MNLKELYTNENGIVIPNTSSMLDKVTEDMRDIFGDGLDATPETPMGRFLEFLSMSFKRVLGVNAQNANQQNIYTATGRYLDGHGSIYGIYRYGASYSTVVATFTGTANATIPVGFRVSSEDGSATFVLREPATLNSQGTVNATMYAVDEGPVACAKGRLTVIETSTADVTSVTNGAAAVLGRLEETDEALRARILASLSTGRDFLASLRNAILGIEGVSSCVVYENGKSTDEIVNKVLVEGHSILVCVEGGDDEEVANAIYQAKPAGCGYTTTALNVNTDDIQGGSLVTVQVVDDSNGNATYYVSFYRPCYYSPSVSVAFSRNKYAGSVDTLKTAIKETVTGFCNALPVGAACSTLDIGRVLMEAFPSVWFRQITINGQNTFESFGIAKFNMAESNVSVEEV